MARPTSIETYHEVEASGLLSRRRLEAYRIVCKYGPMTANEALQQIQKEAGGYISPHRAKNTHARFTELWQMGAIREKEERPCGVTGNNAIVWEVTGNLPHSLPKRHTRASEFRQQRDMLLAALSACCKALPTFPVIQEAQTVLNTVKTQMRGRGND